MATQSLDLVYELQVELGWSPDFAATAHSEYVRWLRLRAQSGDFQYCKLPPSRAVGTVWGLHRQWTQDYEKTCRSLGGFIHHFPPAMRMNIAREEAYAATLHTYKALFDEEPPVSHWGPAICTYKPLSSNGVTHVPASSKNPPPRALPSLRRSPTKRDASAITAPTTPTKGKRANAEARRASSTKGSAIGNTVDRSRAALENAKSHRRSPKSGVDARRISLPIQDVVMEDGEHRSPGRPRKRFSGPSPLYVLKPLRPGEKRKRGRPSFSDYVLASSLSLSRTSADAKKRDVKSAIEKTATVKSPGGAHSMRRRKGASSSKAPTPPPGIVKKERPHKPFRRVARWSEASKVGDFNKTASLNPPAVVATPSGEQKKEGQQTQGTPGPGKRPRGRPRKDGSWPIPRIRKPETSSKSAPTVPQKSTMNGSEKKKEQGAQEAGVKNVVSGSPAAPEETTNEMPTQVPPRETPETPSSAPAPTNVPATSNGSSGSAPPSGPPAQDANSMPNVSSEAAPGQSGQSGAPEAPQTETVPIPESTETSAQKQATPVEDPLVQETVENPVPSKVVEGRDIQVQDLADKDVSKSTPVHDHLPRGGVFEQIMDGSGLVDKDRQGDISNSLSGRDVRMGQDVAFPQTETIRDPTDMEIPLSARPENIPNLPGTTSDIIPASQSGEKLMPQTGPFSMNPLNIVPAVSGPLDSSMLSIGGPSVQPRVDGEGDKDVDISLEEGDPKKPFKRPRGRPRKDGSWPMSRAKSLNEEAVERVKDMGEASLNFPVGPSEAV